MARAKIMHGHSTYSRFQKHVNKPMFQKYIYRPLRYSQQARVNIFMGRWLAKMFLNSTVLFGPILYVVL